MNTHATLLKQLLPASYDTNGRVLAAMLQAEGNALDAACLQADMLLTEADPRTALQQIPAWERVFGASANADTPSRRAYLVGKLNETGGQSKQYFIDLAKSLGFTITIDEFTPADILADVMNPMFSLDWLFAWRVNAAANANYRQATVLDTVMDGFASWGNADFEAALREDAPAHTQVLFAYI
ncbi:MAG: putative phage tail protein [Nitrosomonadales bacterium]